MILLTFIYIGGAALGVIGGVAFALDKGSNGMNVEGLGQEGHVLIGVLGGVLWPLLFVVLLAYAAAYVGRGAAQIWRAVFPAAPALPVAEVRRRARK